MTEPLTPRYLDLRDFPYLPIDIARLLGSEFHAIADAEQFRAGLILWLKSYHQVPAASLPSDDNQLIRLAEFRKSLRNWRQIRDVVLRGWVLCNDGRLYHPVIAEKALAAGLMKMGKRKSSEAGNAKRWGLAHNETSSNQAIREMAVLLSALNPHSRSLKKKYVLCALSDSQSDPTGIPNSDPDAIPTGFPNASERDPNIEREISKKRKIIASAAPEAPSEPASSPQGRRRKPATSPMPDPTSFEFDALRSAFFEYGREKKFGEPQLADEFEGFIGHHRAKGTVFADWRQAGQNWLRKSRAFRPNGGAPQGRPQI
ncbi:DUF1376 domain-containing protein [Bradyrhizobium sp. Pha-3]|uniref:DUF1376 domain-containing protein n=1 Tax=Bradyrhizobium sp. Pha-3 TaxID=208375 RepID=UPI0035D50C6F